MTQTPTYAFAECPATAEAQAYPLIDYHTNSWGNEPGCVHLELRMSAQGDDVIFVDAERKDGVTTIRLSGPYELTDATPAGYIGLKVIEARGY